MGEGGLGDVWKAHDTTNGRLVALRILPTPPPGDPFRFARFDDDIRKVIRLRHPNVARTYELIDGDQVRALACEWVSGESLANRIAAGPIPVDEAIRIIAQVANGLGAAHSRDLVHGDVKPSNIRLRADGAVKVIDLGLLEVYEPAGMMPPSDVRPAPSARLLGAITGTAAYMSPEQIAGHAADNHADVWAFGCVLYEMLTGKPAFGVEDLSETMARVAGTEPEWTLIPPAAPISLVRMLRRCLEKDARRRFQRLTEVLGPIRSTIGEEGAVEAFLRQSTLRRMPPGHVEPEWSEQEWIESVLKVIPSLRRWASGRLPRGLPEDTDDLIQEAIADILKKVGRGPSYPSDALSAYLRRNLAIRIRDVMRKRRLELLSRAEDVDDGIDFETTVQYRSALGDLSERERALIESRLDSQDSYDEIASRFSFPTVAAARMAVTRALKRLAELMAKKLRE
jgi:serine/threonine protein kinase